MAISSFWWISEQSTRSDLDRREWLSPPSHSGKDSARVSHFEESRVSRRVKSHSSHLGSVPATHVSEYFTQLTREMETPWRSAWCIARDSYISQYLVHPDINPVNAWLSSYPSPDDQPFRLPFCMRNLSEPVMSPSHFSELWKMLLQKIHWHSSWLTRNLQTFTDSVVWEIVQKRTTYSV